MPRPMHIDMPADDMKRATTFFSNVFGWKFEGWGQDSDDQMATTGEAADGVPLLHDRHGMRFHLRSYAYAVEIHSASHTRSIKHHTVFACVTCFIDERCNQFSKQ